MPIGGVDVGLGHRVPCNGAQGWGSILYSLLNAEDRMKELGAEVTGAPAVTLTLYQ
jgi:hypothetical protein